MQHAPRFARTLPALAALLLVLALLSGCASMPRMLGGSGGDVTLVLDGDQLHSATIARGRTLALVLRDPAAKGYALAGTAFNPALLRLEGIEPVDGGRVQYVFTTLDTGQTDVLIKMRRAGQPKAGLEVFKQVTVTVEAP